MHQKCETICTSSVKQSTTTLWQWTSDDSNSMMQTNNQIYAFLSDQGSNWLNPMTAMIKSDQLVCGWSPVKRQLTKNIWLTKCVEHWTLTMHILLRTKPQLKYAQQMSFMGYLNPNELEFRLSRTMMYANSHGHVTRHMWAIIKQFVLEQLVQREVTSSVTNRFSTVRFCRFWIFNRKSLVSLMYDRRLLASG